MIESCTKRRMLITIVALGGLSLLVFGFETFLTKDDNHSISASPSSNESKHSCGMSTDFKIIKECQSCSSFDISMELPACLPTGYKESIKCEDNDPIWRSCSRLPWLEKRNFLIFESVTFFVGIFSGMVTFGRQRQLNRLALDKIQKQIAAGV